MHLHAFPNFASKNAVKAGAENRNRLQQEMERSKLAKRAADLLEPTGF